ncbi:hypothetical protein [Pseudolysinimonas kribbensis]|uniref:hypothetical protein n=1 Tax=Pseudolysinimonas kribbensis TaxID=433641 RepID=UPI0031DF7F63
MNAPQRPALLWVLAGLLTLEFLLVAVLAVLSIVSVGTGDAGGVGSGIALAVIVVIAAVWLGAMVIGTLRRQAWIRAAAIVWQIIQIAVGIGVLVGPDAQPLLGWPLVVVAIVAFILLFTPTIVNATRRRGDTAI